MWSALSILFFLLAIKSKQVAVTLPAFLILYELCFVSRGNRKILSKRFIYLKVALVVILLSLTVWKFSQYIVIDSNMYYFHYLLSGSQLTYSHILYNIVTLFTYYVKNILFPLNLLPDYSVLSSKLFLGKTFVLSLSFFVFYLYLICRFYRRHKVVSFGLIWFLLNYLVISPLNSAAYPLADRYIYLPSYGISLAIGVVLNRGMANLTSGRNERLYMAALFTCLFCFSVLTINYNRHWKNNSTLWEYGLRKNPASFPARFNVATEYINKEMFSEAESALMKIPALDPRSNQFFDKNIILIDLYYHRGDVSDAFDLFKANVRRIDGSYNPGLIYPHIYKYASLLSKHGYIKDALRAYDILFREGYRKDIVLRRMKNLRNVQGENRSYKIENLKKAIIANPEDIRPRVNLGILYYEDFSYEMAERELLEALKLDNNSFEAHYDLGLVYKKTKRFEEAAMEFEKAALLRVKVPPVVYDNLGLVYKNLGRDEDSIEQFRMAINVQSDFAISYKHLGDAYRRVGNNAKAVGAYNSFLKY
ncbi:tetratricopeptide repeat protein, partial [bacterium]|nr:tetratricopeptide repeat protein [bacterium]